MNSNFHRHLRTINSQFRKAENPSRKPLVPPAECFSRVLASKDAGEPLREPKLRMREKVGSSLHRDFPTGLKQSDGLVAICQKGWLKARRSGERLRRNFLSCRRRVAQITQLVESNTFSKRVSSVSLGRSPYPGGMRSELLQTKDIVALFRKDRLTARCRRLRTLEAPTLQRKADFQACRSSSARDFMDGAVVTPLPVFLLPYGDAVLSQSGCRVRAATAPESARKA